MNNAPADRIKCPFCGFEFDAASGTAYCGSCPMGKSCRLVRCPNCAYETPAEPRLFAAIKKLRRKR
ncbi:hypothetical protein [Dehalogenimonas sp. 4OHTPN]|uniref:Uncharacterized protein n=1 Tax=Dehalogenimonas sp. 4OHTPN TaxID=3166643 RepID=A0AAU8GAA3_9CHLR